MKKTTKETLKKSTKNTKKTDTKKIKIDATHLYTLDSVTDSIIEAKLNAGISIDKNEVVAIVEHLANFAASILTGIADCDCKIINDMCNELTDKTVKIADLNKQLNWANRPWYKKLMFWKKNPNK